MNEGLGELRVPKALFYDLKSGDHPRLHLFQCGVADGGGSHIRVLCVVCQPVYL